MQILRQYLLISAILFILASVFFLEGCKHSSLSGIIFSHATHLNMGLPCQMCHTMAEQGKKAGMPDHAICMNCHAIDMNKPGKDCLKCHINSDYKIKSPIPEIFQKINFSHEKHLTAGLSCEACHPNLDKSLSIDGTHYPHMEDCLSCHQQKKITTDCISWHPGWDKDHPPQWHSGDWKRIHGTLSQEKNTRCTVCHTQNSCTQCHSIEEPKSHNQFWKQRGHALTVKWERKKCIICHKADFCQKCHENTPPSSHSAGWQQTHCMTCHLPKSDTNCIVCHQNPGHSATTNVRDALPDQQTLVDFMSVNNCLLCHYIPSSGAPTPPHPVKIPCTACHFFN